MTCVININTETAVLAGPVSVGDIVSDSAFNHQCHQTNVFNLQFGTTCILLGNNEYYVQLQMLASLNFTTDSEILARKG